MRTVRFLAAVLAVATLASAACGGGSDSNSDPHAGSGAVCPPGGTTLSYTGGGNGSTEPADFGQTFFAACTSCHSSAVAGIDRGGAPVGVDFDTLVGIRTHAVHIDAAAAAGPNRPSGPFAMPPAGAGPSTADRTLLGVWLACGAPQAP